ncbi:hypothetical protein B4N84_11585 [Flavobacterium sp. IR1]|nr:hypothetical protein B4N84_11585 [Flavobacterium sp. IR1]
MLQMITKLKISYFMGVSRQAKNDHFLFIQNLRRIAIRKIYGRIYPKIFWQSFLKGQKATY